jgi:hypothetical protein
MNNRQYEVSYIDDEGNKHLTQIVSSCPAAALDTFCRQMSEERISNITIKFIKSITL